jgi:hypothetical protein
MIKVLAVLLVFISSCAYTCKQSGGSKLRGKLVIKELCSHYVVQVINGTVDTSEVMNNWRDEKRQQTYNKVFTLSNRCTFPATIKEGEEFDFTFDSLPAVQNCAVCKAYYPTPPRLHAIKILPGK